MDIKKALEKTFTTVLNMKAQGHVASYIPELKKVNPDQFAVSLTTTDMKKYQQGNSKVRFSIQSIAKVLSLSFAYKLMGEKIWKRVGVEPSGSAFNSLVQLEYSNGIPRNPLINSGAIVVCDILMSQLKNPEEELIQFIRNITDNQKINYNLKVANSEKKQGYKNSAMTHLMKSYENIKNKPEDVLDLYFKLCSIELNCIELSSLFLYLANSGVDPKTKRRILSKSQAKRINAILLSCGFYDESGEFTFKVGLPGKSGVGGGIIAIYPQHYCLAVFSPRLNSKGNSYKGMKFLEDFTSRTKMSIF